MPNVTGHLRKAEHSERLQRLSRLGLIVEVPEKRTDESEVAFRDTQRGADLLKDFMDQRDAALAVGIERVPLGYLTRGRRNLRSRAWLSSFINGVS